MSDPPLSDIDFKKKMPWVWIPLNGWTSTVGDLSSTIINGLCSFMLEEWESPIGFSGSIQADSITRKKLAKESGLYNLEKYPIFMELFPGKDTNLF